jgi:hypothetical protein
MDKAIAGNAGTSAANPADGTDNGSMDSGDPFESLSLSGTNAPEAGNTSDAGELPEDATGNNESPATDAGDQGSNPAEDDEGRPKRDRFQERIDKLTAARKTAEEELDKSKTELTQLRKKLEEYEAGATPATAAQPFDMVESDETMVPLREAVNKTKAEVDSARGLRKRLKQEPDAVLELLQSKGVKVETAEDADEWLDDYVTTQRERLGQKQAEMAVHRSKLEAVATQQRGAWDAVAREEFPWVATTEEDDPRLGMLKNAEKAHPWIAKIPQGRAALAALVDIVFRRQKAANGKPGPKPGVRPSAGNGGGGPAARPATNGTGKDQRAAAAAKRLDSNPDDDAAMADFLDGAL